MFREFVPWWYQLGPRHLWFQRQIFKLALLPGLGHILWEFLDWAATGKEFHVVSTLLKLLSLLVGWAVVALFTTLIFFLASTLFNLDLHIYYRFWLRKLKPLFLSPTAREMDIIRSFDYFMTADGRWRYRRPCFVEREDLVRRGFWPGWVFSIVTLFGRNVHLRVIGDGRHGRKWFLDVDLQNESYGIYSNDGKKYLRAQFLEGNRAAHAEVVRRSASIYNFTRPGNKSTREYTWGESGGVLPLRWASGGFLPIVRYREDYWVLLFLRDRRPPVGLNAPNGASETKDEYKDIKRLMGREFCEEVVILSGPPSRDAEVFQTDFETKDQFASFVSPEFSEKHVRLRREADGLVIRKDPSEQMRDISFIETPFAAHVRFHDSDLKATRESTVHNIVFSINPAEFGIEVMALCTFELREGEYVIGGEYDLSRQVLIRELPVLLRLRYLAEVYRNNGTLGTLQEEGNSFDGKLLEFVPANDCRIFDADVAFRKTRKQTIEDQVKKMTSPHHRSNLEWERKNVVEDWLSRYESTVAAVGQKGLQGAAQPEKELRTLCPVVWKTLELAFAHGLLSHLPKKPTHSGSRWPGALAARRP
jgi:hypothetical protein